VSAQSEGPSFSFETVEAGGSDDAIEIGIEATVSSCSRMDRSNGCRVGEAVCLGVDKSVYLGDQDEDTNYDG